MSDRLLQNARIVVEVSCGVKAGDAVLIVIQKNTKQPYGDEQMPIARALAQACVELKAIPLIADLTDWVGSSAYKAGKVQPSLAAAVKAADVVINAADMIAFGRMTGEPEPDMRRCASGEQRWFAMQTHKMAEWQLTPERVAMIAKRSRWLVALIEKSKTLKVTGPAGTDIAFDLTSGVFVLTYLWLVPLFGEVPVVPHQANGNGVMMVDGPTQKNVRRRNELDRQPLRIEIKDGLVKKYSGDPEQVKRLEAFMNGGDPRADKIDEIGILTTDLPENSKYWWEDGTHDYRRCHIALGNNKERKADVHGRAHMDCEICQPTVSVDGLVVVRDGVFVDANLPTQ